jgi:hypothetical protein
MAGIQYRIINFKRKKIQTLEQIIMLHDRVNTFRYLK